MQKLFSRLYPIQVAYLFAVAFTNAMLLLWFQKEGASYSGIILFYIIIYATAVASIAAFRSIRPRLFFILGIICNMAIFAIYAFGFKKEYLPFIALLYGPLFVLFWINYNILFFGNIDPDKKAFSSAVYAFAFSLLSTVTPIMAGFTASKAGMQAVFIIGIAFMAIALLLSARIGEKRSYYNLRISLKCIKGVKTIIFIEGFWEHITFVAIPLLSLFFIQNELGLGAYLSYLGLTGAVASLVIARISDRIKKRRAFIRILAVSLAIATMLLIFGSNIYLWIIFTGIIYLIAPALKPFQTTVSLDNVKCGMRELMIGREFMLNLGRLCGICLFLMSMAFGMKYGSIFLAAIAMMAYPVVMKMKGHYEARSN